jgi:hypothetical protein
LNLDKLKLHQWFNKNNSKEKRAQERPLITEEHKRARLRLVKCIDTLRSVGAAIYYLGEKLFNFYK